MTRSTRLISLLVLGMPALLAQGSQTAQITGRVLIQGRPLTGAMVRLTSSSLQGANAFVTDEQGRFTARLLPPGLYTVEVVKEGHQKLVYQQRLGLGQHWSPCFTVVPTGSAEVQVLAARPEVDKTEVQIAKNIRMEEINVLATERGATDILRLSPGVLEHPNGFLIRGGLSTSNLFLVDGQNVQDNIGTVNAGLGCTLIEDSIEEYQVLRGAIPAEYGGMDGGVVNTVTRSGGNEFTAIFRMELKNDAKGALKPFENAADIPDVWRKASSLAVGGYLIKDRLWFFCTGYHEVRSDRAAINGDAQPGTGGQGTTYASAYRENRFQGKLTWALSQDHSLVLAMNHDNLNQGNMNPGFAVGEIRALEPLHYEDSFANLTWRAVWTGGFVTEARVGQKHLFQRIGGDPGLGTPVLDESSPAGYVYQNGLFNAADGGDTRDNQTANVKASLVWEGLGPHQTDAGVDFLKETNRARRDGSPTGRIAYSMFPTDFDLADRRAHPDFMAVFQTGGGEASIQFTGLYAHDRWNLNDHLAVQAGLRWDRYTAQNEGGATLASSASLSPRVGMKFDFFADATWVAGLSLGRYTGRVPGMALFSVTNQYNPTEIHYSALDQTQLLSFEALGNPANYSGSASSYSSPALTRINPDLKAPQVDELQASLAYSYKSPLGEGFLRATMVEKSWHHMVDWRIGNDGASVGPDGQTYALKYWDNSSLAKRAYRALELEGGHSWKSITLSGSLTWSSLRGNYQGESAGNPGSGEGLQNFSTYQGQALYTPEALHPYGYLPGHTPLRIRLLGNWVTKNILGKASLGLVYRFNSGTHFDEVRTNEAAALSAALPAQFGSTFTQYRDNARGTGVFNSTARFDLAINQDFDVTVIHGRPLSAFTRLLVVNVFNHQQIETFNTNVDPAVGSLNAPWKRDADYGRALSPDNFVEPRGIQIHIGVRF